MKIELQIFPEENFVKKKNSLTSITQSVSEASAVVDGNRKNLCSKIVWNESSIQV